MIYTLRRRRRYARFLGLIIFLLLAFPIVIVYSGRPRIISPLPDKEDTPVSQSQPAQTPTARPKQKANRSTDELRGKIKAIADPTWHNYSVVVADFTSDFSVAVDDAVIYDAASVNKIPILLVLYSLVQEGQVDLGRIITLQARDIQDYGTGSIRYAKAGTTYSVKTLAKLMIKQSDNTAAYILANHIVGLKKIQEVINSWGLTQTDMTENTTSNRDQRILMEKLVRGRVANQALTQEMLDFFRETEFEDRLPLLLPDTVKVYHKIGTNTGVIHDVGVVAEDDTTYYIGVFIGDVSDEEGAKQTIAQISKTVYEYMTR